jgi:hypothetical protein
VIRRRIPPIEKMKNKDPKDQLAWMILPKKKRTTNTIAEIIKIPCKGLAMVVALFSAIAAKKDEAIAPTIQK